MSYDFNEIKARANCLEIAVEIGLTVDKDGRCAAAWRNGDNPTAISINESGWHDFVTEESGSVIDLVAKVKYGGFIQTAAKWLGERLHLEPSKKFAPRPQSGSRYEILIDEGYKEVKRYNYIGMDGSTISQVVRLEHPVKPKQFLQCDGSGRWGVKGVDLILYNMPAIVASDWAVIVEGEKDADTLIDMGIPATTNVGGAKKWCDAYSDVLAGKSVILLPDNDDAGRAHLHMIGKSLAGKAAEIRFLTISSRAKGDVTDWMLYEGGTYERLMGLLKSAPSWIEPRNDEIKIANAKEANEAPLRNYVANKVQEGNKIKIEKTPRRANDIAIDIHTRFLGFPRKIGDVLFDHDRDTGRIEHILSTSELFAWMQVKSNNLIDWARGDAMVTREDMYNTLKDAGKRYEAIAHVPDWPTRDDTYYAHDDLPEPTPNHAAFEGLLDFFNPATPEYRVLLKALFSAPLFYRRGVPRPMWVIDSDDGAGTGKTTLAEAVADLYASDPIQCQRYDLSNGMDDLIKRMVSSSGRRARVFLLDNITGNYRSEELSGLITRATITGKAPYGRGEESRPNNLTYILTANSAALDNDLSIRAFYIFVKRSDTSAAWKSQMMSYIHDNRLYIFADLLDVLNRGSDFEIKPQTRFPEYEADILAPHCANLEEYKQVIDTLDRVRQESNVEEELSDKIEETLREKLTAAGHNPPDYDSVFIRSELVQEWLGDLFPPRANVMQEVRNLAKNELLSCVDPEVKRYPRGSKAPRRSGILWAPNGEKDALFSLTGKGKKITKVFHADLGDS